MESCVMRQKVQMRKRTQALQAGPGSIAPLNQPWCFRSTGTSATGVTQGSALLRPSNRQVPPASSQTSGSSVKADLSLLRREKQQSTRSLYQHTLACAKPICKKQTKNPTHSWQYRQSCLWKWFCRFSDQTVKVVSGHHHKHPSKDL